MIRIGIIGSDNIAHLHTGALLTNNNYEIAGCYAPDNRDSMVFARHYRVVSYSSLEALFKYTDAIDITEDFPELMVLAEKSLKGMKHVYIAQPQRLTVSEIEYLTKIANESGVALQLGSGYRYCAAYDALAELNHKPGLVDIKHHLLRDDKDVFVQLRSAISNDLDMILGLLATNIQKIDVKSWTKSEGVPDLLNCRLDCDNGCSINIVQRIIPEGESKLDVTFNLPDMVVNVDVFKSVIVKQYCELDVVDTVTLDAYNEKAIHKQELKNFYAAICNDTSAICRIERKIQSIAAADLIVERIRQTQAVTNYS